MKRTKTKIIPNSYKERDVKYWKDHLLFEISLSEIQTYNDRVLFTWLPQALGAEEELAVKEAAKLLNLEVTHNSILLV